ncbi:MAG: hypothetical protein RIS75_529 [Actinomycetota bacterium]
MKLLPATADVVVIGAGVVGASCAHYLAEAGLRVLVLDRGAVASGTTGAGEGNILVSDKEIGAELELALYSNRLWRELTPHISRSEFEVKGGIVVATSDAVLRRLREIAEHQRTAGVEAIELDADQLHDHEPHLTRDVHGAVLYPQDSQVQPMLAAAQLVHRPDGRITVVTNTDVVGIDLSTDGNVVGVSTSRGKVSTPNVVNAAGTWSGEIAALAGVNLPIMPRRGFILVTAPMPPMVHHKVYTAEYLANVASDNEGLETSTVVEGTHAGTILIGASRERVGFDRTINYEVLSKLAAGAISIFPFLRDTKLLRTYGGFRPYCPDHLPVIGPDERVPGLYHACGHEGAGVGLAPASGKLIADTVVGQPTEISLHPFRPQRFDEAGAHV